MRGKGNPLVNKKLFTRKEMDFMIYDLGHNAETLLDYHNFGTANEILWFLRRNYKISMSKVKKHMVTQNFRMYKLWGLNACEVVNLLAIDAFSDDLSILKKEAYLAREWKGYSFGRGPAFGEDRRSTGFLENAVKYGLTPLDIKVLVGGTLEKAQWNAQVLDILDNSGVSANIMTQLEINSITPPAYRINEYVGREYQRGWSSDRDFPV